MSEPVVRAEARHVYSVSTLTHALKRTLEDEFCQVWVEGEVSGYKVSQSGHAYFTFKDEGAQISGVLFFGVRSKLAGNEPQDGQKVRLWADLTVFAPRGQYQLVVRKIQPLGEGDLMARFLELKQRLTAEGLFADERKRLLPRLPQRLGVVTSATGSVIHDMLKVLSRRYPNVQVRLLPVKVQGVGAAEEIAAAVAFFNRHCHAQSAWPADVLIVGRGGGSLEELWPFNEEVVVRALAQSHIPTISAVGHQTDTLLTDYVADVRAPTPSAAAEIVVPAKADLEERVRQLEVRLSQGLERQVRLYRQRLATAQAARYLKHPLQLVERFAQHRDTLAMQLEHLVHHRVVRAQGEWERADAHFRLVQERLFRHIALRLETATYRLSEGLKSAYTAKLRELEKRQQKLELLDPLAILSRGYALVQDEQGRVVRSVQELKPEQCVRTRLKEGIFNSRVTEIS